MKKGALAAFLLCIALAQIAVSRAASVEPQSTSQINTRQEGMLLTVEGLLQTKADRAKAWAVLTDYEHFPAFVPGITSNQVLETKKGLKTIAQKGQVFVGQVRMPYEGIMQVTEYHLQGMDIRFLSGPFKDVVGAWRVSAGRPVKLTYSLRMDLSKTPFPPPLAPSIAQQQVSTWVDAFGQEMERRAEK